MKAEEIATELRERIEAGRLPPDQRPANALPPGSPIPTVDALEAEHGVSRATAGRVHTLLKSVGLIHTKSGRSALVADQSPLYVITADAYGQARPANVTAWEHQVKATGQAPRTDQYAGALSTGADWGIDGGGETVADLLEVAEGTELVHLAGDGWSSPPGADGEPDPKLAHVVQIYDMWAVPDLLERAPKLLEPRDGDWQGGAFGLIGDLDGRFPQPDPARVITERVATPSEAARFRVSPLTLVSAEVETSVDQQGAKLCVVWYRRLFGVAQWRLAGRRP